MVQAKLSAPRPLRMTRPDTKMPTAQLVRIRLAKKAASARPMPIEVEAEEADREQRHRHHADGEPHDAHHHQRDHELDRPERADHEIGEIARPHLLEKRHREAELAAEQDVPQQHGADEGAAGAGEEPGILADIELQEAPHHHLHRRPVDELQEPRPRRAQQVPVARDHRADAPAGDAVVRAQSAGSLIGPPPRSGRAPRRERPPPGSAGRSARAARPACRRPRSGLSS